MDISLDPSDPNQKTTKTTLEQQASLIATNMTQYLFVSALEKAATAYVIEKDSKAINKLKGKSNKTAGEHIIDLYADIKGV